MNNQFIDYYEILGVSKNTTIEEMGYKYQEIMKFLSPESHPGKTYSMYELRELKEQKRMVTEAYQTLRNKDSKALYDTYYDRYKEEAIQPRKKRMDRHEVSAPAPISFQPSVKSNQQSQPRREQPVRQYHQPRREEPVRQRQYQSKTQPVRQENLRAKTEQKESFLKSIKRQYREVRQDEKSDSLRMRHSRLDDYFKESFLEKVTTVPREILYHTGKGITHVSFEAIYQLAKLRYINKDAFTKFLIRNRKLIAVATIAGVMFTNGLVGDKTEEMENIPPVYPTYEPTEMPTPMVETTVSPSYEPRVVLNRNYTIVAGDTLSRLSYNANSSISELKQINGFETDRIYYGRKMWIPYTIDREDLEYYTEKVKANDYTLQEIAKIYETDIETLCLLNKESIINTGNNTYFILSDSLLVPHFATKQEVIEQKQAKYHQ